MLKPISFLFALLLLFSCVGKSGESDSKVDSLLFEAYRVRYTDADSTAFLANKAISLANDDKESVARAINLLAFVRYHEMNYGDALSLCDSVYLTSNNQVTLLCADVMRMKVCQRIGDGRKFYEARSSAGRRLKRIEEELAQLSVSETRDYQYSKSEYHIISSTYYYYQDEDSLAKAEMAAIGTLPEEKLDTTQLLNYLYMMGSGGLVDGSYEDVVISEFDYLINCYATSLRSNNAYFEGNALQALSMRLRTDYDRQIIQRHSFDSYGMLFGQHIMWMPQDSVFSEKNLPGALARHALSIFLDYNDLFQSACVYRTIGEIAFYDGNYEMSVAAFDSALNCVNKHHQLYYPKSPGHLYVYNPVDTCLFSTERGWIEDESVLTVPEWMAGIRQQLSMTFSAMDMKRASDYNRNIYIDILESTSQNREMESRMLELEEESSVQHHLLIAASVVFLLLLVLFVFLVLRLRSHADSAGNARILRDDKTKVDELVDRLEETEEAYQVSRMRIAQNKVRNAEKRAKVSLVQAVTPFLDRILNAVARIKRNNVADDSQIQYIAELSEKIVEYNSILTEWIQMEKGQLALQISTVDLQEIFSILERGHYAYDQQGILLCVEPTDLSVKADKALTLFMLNTLADNARKFTPSGGSVTISAQATEQYVELSVRDTGCGLREEDIDLILNSKVYDASQIGLQSQETKTKKGFGFGLMNCKGIIEKYKKTSNLFSCCLFGIESKVGEGSRFFFRLPRVLMVLLSFILSQTLYADNSLQDSVQESFHELAERDVDDLATYYYQQVYDCNVAGYYADALNYADSALYAYNPSLQLYQDAMSDEGTPKELEAFRNGERWDYMFLINLRNEIAVAALAMHYWDLYRYNNKICINLHKLYNQDTTLPTYCDKLQQAKSVSQQITVLLVLLSLIAIIVIYMLFRGRRKKAEDISNKLLQRIDKQEDLLSHSRFEESRLYVQNQVLDNCLSTIKHESMYYPSRILQLVSCEDVDVEQLDELTQYYKQMYTLLSGQAERQTASSGQRRESLDMASIIEGLPKLFTQMSRKCGVVASLDVEIANRLSVRADGTLIEELFKQMFLYLLNAFPSISNVHIILEQQGKFACVKMCSPQIHFSEQEIHNLFYPSRDRIPLLVVKQIVRDTDALNNNPGLRLEGLEDGIWFSLPISHE